MRLARPANVACTSTTATHRTILLVGEDDATRSKLAEQLSGLGLGIDHTYFGLEALARFRSACYRLVIVDLPDGLLLGEELHELVCTLSAAPCEIGGEPQPARKPDLYQSPENAHPNLHDRPAYLILCDNADQSTHGLAFLHEQLIGALAKPFRKRQFQRIVKHLLSLEANLRAERLNALME